MNKNLYKASDLALEAVGAKHTRRKINGFEATQTELNGSRAVTLGIDGKSADTAEKRRRAAMALSAAITEHLPNIFSHSSAPVTVICIGNGSLTADSLGPLCAEKIIATRHLKSCAPEIFSALGRREISVLKSEVAALCGIDALELAKMCVSVLGSELIVTVDSLKAASADNLYRVVQITDKITPGSGIGNNRPSISEKALGVPVIALGVPTAISAATLISETLISSLSIAPTIDQNTKNCGKSDSYSDRFFTLLERQKSLLVTPIDCDIALKRYSSIIAAAINHTLLGTVTDEI